MYSTTMTNFNIDLTDCHASNFIDACEISLYSQFCKDSPINSLAGKYKGIVNANNHKQIFNIVGAGYKIIQHKEVFEVVHENLTNLGMNAKIRSYEVSDGGRLRLDVDFPDLQVRPSEAIQGEIVNLRIAIDNSYNGSTGLRCVVQGYCNQDGTVFTLPYRFAKFYHKHTQGADSNNMGMSLEKGINIYKTKVKELWDNYYNTKLDPQKVVDFLAESLEKASGSSSRIIADKYMKEILEVARVKRVTNQWELFALVAKIMTHAGSSLDIKEKAISDMDKFISANVSKLLMG